MTHNKIFIVDDDKTMCAALRKMLIAKDYDVTVLYSGIELLAHLEASPENIPDLILLDVVMPGMDGFKTCRQVKASPQFQHIPIILVTALDAKRVLSKGIESGADDFLQKPVNHWELLARIRSMLRIKKQYDELEAMLHLREDLSNMLVHDMSSPITAIHLHTTKLKNHLNQNDAEAFKEIDLISAAAEQLDNFIGDMLMMAKLEQSHLRLNPQPTNVSTLVHQLIQDFKIIADSRDIDLELEMPGNPFSMELDGNLFRRLLANILSNALKYSPSLSRVLVRLDFCDHDNCDYKLRIEVIDEGEGIPSAYRDRIFDKFDVVKLKKQGLRQIGLGLAFCKLVIDAHQGHIYVKDNQPHGAIFVVEI